jgi:hypothetical protein
MGYKHTALGLTFPIAVHMCQRHTTMSFDTLIIAGTQEEMTFRSKQKTYDV